MIELRRGAEADVDDALVAASAVTYLEGYLFDPPAAQAAFRKAAAAAHAAGRQVALSLSDAFCVDRHRAAFSELADIGVTWVLFTSATKSLTATSDFLAEFAHAYVQ